MAEKLICTAVTLNKKWKRWMDNNQETLLEEDFVTMAFGEAFVKELKTSGAETFRRGVFCSKLLFLG
jgi:hypothetical protein